MAVTVRWIFRTLALLIIALFIGGLVVSRNDRDSGGLASLDAARRVVRSLFSSPSSDRAGDGGVAADSSTPVTDAAADAAAAARAIDAPSDARISASSRAGSGNASGNPLRANSPTPPRDISTADHASVPVATADHRGHPPASRTDTRSQPADGNVPGTPGRGASDHSSNNSGNNSGNNATSGVHSTASATGTPALETPVAAIDEELTEPISIADFLRGDSSGERARLLGIEPSTLAENGVNANGVNANGANANGANANVSGVNANANGAGPAQAARSALGGTEADRVEFASTAGGDAGLLKLAKQLQRDGRMPQDFRRRDQNRLPNILLVVVENLSREDIGAYGQPLIHTPFLDRLAAGGLRLNQCAGSSVGRAMERTALWYGDLSTAARPGNAKLLRLPRPDLPAELIRAGYLTMLLGECGWPRGSVATQPSSTWDAWAGWSDFADARFQAFPTSIPDHEGDSLVESNRSGPQARFDAVLTSACHDMLAPLRERRPARSPLNAIPSLLFANVDLRWWEDSVEPGPEYRIAEWTIEEQRHAAAVTALDAWLRAVAQEFDAARGQREVAIVVIGLPRWRKAKHQQRFRDAVPALDAPRSSPSWPYAPVIAAWPRHIPAGRVVNTFCGLHDILPTLLEMANDESPPRSGSGSSQWRVWMDEEGG